MYGGARLTVDINLSPFDFSVGVDIMRKKKCPHCKEALIDEEEQEPEEDEDEY